MKKFFKSLTVLEWIIWSVSTVAAIVSFFIFKNENYHYLIGAVIGFTAVLLVSKGNPIGQLIMVVFSVFYGVISFSFKYYGEMITYLGMSAPMAVIALIVWLKNPFNGDKGEVKVNSLQKKEVCLFIMILIAVTFAFYFILRSFGTANLVISTVSVSTSFSAAYLTMRRSRFYAVGYALNDCVLIVMWVLACRETLTYLPMVVCFASFLSLDIYGFVNWSRISKRQSAVSCDRTKFESITDDGD